MRTARWCRARQKKSDSTERHVVSTHRCRASRRTHTHQAFTDTAHDSCTRGDSTQRSGRGMHDRGDRRRRDARRVARAPQRAERVARGGVARCGAPQRVQRERPQVARPRLLPHRPYLCAAPRPRLRPRRVRAHTQAHSHSRTLTHTHRRSDAARRVRGAARGRPVGSQARPARGAAPRAPAPAPRRPHCPHPRDVQLLCRWPRGRRPRAARAHTGDAPARAEGGAEGEAAGGGAGGDRHERVWGVCVPGRARRGGRRRGRAGRRSGGGPAPCVAVLAQCAAPRAPAAPRSAAEPGCDLKKGHRERTGWERLSTESCFTRIRACALHRGVRGCADLDRVHVELVRSRGGGERKGERGGDGTDALERRRHGHLHCQRFERKRPRLAPLLRPATGRLSAAPAPRARSEARLCGGAAGGGGRHPP